MRDADEEQQQQETLPLVEELQQALAASPRSEVDGDRLLARLGEEFIASEAEALFETFVSWTRACGLFRYNRELDRFRAGEA